MTEFDRHMAGEESVLRGIAPRASTAPARQEVLAQAYLRASLTKEKRMTLIERLFAGRPLVAQLGIAALLLLAVTVTSVLLMPGPGALAATESVVLNYDLSSFDKEAAKSKFNEIEAAVNANLPKGVKVLTADVKAQIRREKRVVKHDGVEQGAPEETETRQVNGIIVLSDADDAAIAQLNEAVAKAVPGVAAPKIEDATWFRENGAAIGGGINITLSLNGAEHVFNFPQGTSADQIKSQIKDWVEANHPGVEFNVDVNVSGDGKEEQQVEVRIEGKTDEER
jgi:hypothetical protein